MIESDGMAETWLEAETETIGRHRGWFRALAVGWIVLGALAILVPLATALTIERLLGWVFVFGGGLHLVHVFGIRGWRGVLVTLLAGIVYLVAGAILLLNPLEGVLLLTLVLAAVFVSNGVIAVVLAFRLRPHSGWGGVLLSGILGIVVGAMIWAQFPSRAAWAIGTLAGVNMIFGGLTTWRVAATAKTQTN